MVSSKGPEVCRRKVPQAFFYLCERCELRFPATESLESCPSCRGKLYLKATRKLETDNFQAVSKKLKPPALVLLDNLRSSWNVGSILRTGEAAGFSHFIFAGITPTPEHQGVSKTALGAEKRISWEYTPDGAKKILELKEKGLQVWSLETEGHFFWHPDLSPPPSPPGNCGGKPTLWGRSGNNRIVGPCSSPAHERGQMFS